MSEAKKKSGAPFLAAMFLAAMLLAYPLSFGPACWWFSRPMHHGFTSSTTIPSHIAPQFYWPIGWLAVRTDFVHLAIARYAQLGMRPGFSVGIPTEFSGRHSLIIRDF